MHIKNRTNFEKWISYEAGDVIVQPNCYLSQRTILGIIGPVEMRQLIISDAWVHPWPLPDPYTPLKYDLSQDLVFDCKGELAISGNFLDSFLNFEVRKKYGAQMAEYYNELLEKSSLKQLKEKSIKNIEHRLEAECENMICIGIFINNKLG
jgi:hypothetical protein